MTIQEHPSYGYAKDVVDNNIDAPDYVQKQCV